MICTWENCNDRATTPQVGRDGVWANLCDRHAKELDDSITLLTEGGSPAKMISCWIKAQGGAKSMAERM